MNLVFDQSVNKVDAGAGRLGFAGNAFKDIFPIVGNKFEIQAGYGLTGPATAACIVLHGLFAIAAAGINGFDQFKEQFAAGDFGGRRTRKDRTTFDFDNPHERRKSFDRSLLSRIGRK